MLDPVILLRDGNAAIGTPWEMAYNTFKDSKGKQKGVWFESKQGEVPGYRSSIALVPQYKIGCFIDFLNPHTHTHTHKLKYKA